MVSAVPGKRINHRNSAEEVLPAIRRFLADGSCSCRGGNAPTAAAEEAGQSAIAGAAQRTDPPEGAGAAGGAAGPASNDPVFECMYSCTQVEIRFYFTRSYDVLLGYVIFGYVILSNVPFSSFCVS